MKTLSIISKTVLCASLCLGFCTSLALASNTQKARKASPAPRMVVTIPQSSGGLASDAPTVAPVLPQSSSWKAKNSAQSTAKQANKPVSEAKVVLPRTPAPAPSASVQSSELPSAASSTPVPSTQESHASPKSNK